MTRDRQAFLIYLDALHRRRAHPVQSAGDACVDFVVTRRANPLRTCRRCRVGERWVLHDIRRIEQRPIYRASITEDATTSAAMLRKRSSLAYCGNSSTKHTCCAHSNVSLAKRGRKETTHATEKEVETALAITALMDGLISFPLCVHLVRGKSRCKHLLRSFMCWNTEIRCLRKLWSQICRRP
jgi:hypothetical protein